MAEITAPQRLLKHPESEEVFEMDFSNRMSSTAKISSVSVSSERVGANTTDLTITGATISSTNQSVTFTIKSGVDSYRYKIKVKATLDSGEIIPGIGLLKLSNG